MGKMLEQTSPKFFKNTVLDTLFQYTPSSVEVPRGEGLRRGGSMIGGGCLCNDVRPFGSPAGFWGALWEVPLGST